MYKLRKEYKDVSIDNALADHRAHCENFKRLINSEVIGVRNTRGLVLLWAGLTATDKKETREELKVFMREDPLIVKDMVEKWDIIDLEPKPAAEPAVVDVEMNSSSAGGNNGGAVGSSNGAKVSDSATRTGTGDAATAGDVAGKTEKKRGKAKATAEGASAKKT